MNDTFAYDNASRLTQANNGRYNNLVTRAYDAGGRMTSEALTVNGQTYPVASGYDAANRRTSITYPNGKIVAQTFTNRDQLLNVKYDAVNVSTFAYDLGGRKTTNTFGNSKVETRTYRADNRTNTIVTPTGIANFAYAWDVNKNKTQENDTALPTNVQDYSYDNEDRLTGFARNSGQTQAWTLSLVGDWSAFNDNGSAQTRTHNAVHELTGINATPLAYDAKGNLTTNPNGQGYTWDFENCMKTAVVGADTATYTYDAFRRRVTKNFQGTTTVFVYDGWRSISEYENGAALTAPARVYVFGTYLDEPLMMLAGSTKYYYHANDLYSVAALTNSAGTVVERYKYDPYGKVTVLDAAGAAKVDPNNSEFGNPFLWQSQRKDKETGNAYFKNRYYSYELGRFISRWVDQVADVQFYQFQFAMPLVLTDPLGDPLETPWDIANVIYDGGKLIYGVGKGAVTGDWSTAGEAIVDGVTDIGATLVPGVPAGGTKAVRAVKALDAANDARKAADKANDARKAAEAADAARKAADAAADAKKAAAAREAAEKVAKEKAAKEAAEEAQRKARRIAGCEAAYWAYKNLDCKKCTPCMTKEEILASIACYSAEIAGRSKYLDMNCDYILPGSIAKGSAVAERGHKQQISDKKNALANCYIELAKKQ